MNGSNQPQQGMQLFDAAGRRLYFTEEERRAFLAAAAKTPREVRTFCGILHATGTELTNWPPGTHKEFLFYVRCLA